MLGRLVRIYSQYLRDIEHDWDTADWLELFLRLMFALLRLNQVYPIYFLV